MTATPDGRGYWLVAADGGDTETEDPGFYGSEGGYNPASPHNYGVSFSGEVESPRGRVGRDGALRRFPWSSPVRYRLIRPIPTFSVAFWHQAQAVRAGRTLLKPSFGAALGSWLVGRSPSADE
jgi:hypothetical protein